MNRPKAKSYLFFIIGASLLLCFSCSDNEDYEVVSSKDILPQAKGQYDYSEDTTSHDTIKLNRVEQRLKDTLPNIQFSKKNNLEIENTLLMPNQLGYNEKNETYFSFESIPFHFVEWTFTDSSKTVHAFYNWLDCFGNDCRSIKINEEENGCKQAFIIWVSNSSISYLESPRRIKEKDWKGLLSNKKGAWNFIIQQAPNRKINWLESLTKKL